MDRVSFLDAIFILNMRIRLIRDTMRLNPPPELFLEKTLDDLEFINSILDTFVRNNEENSGNTANNGEEISISDTEWQFSQLLTEFSINLGRFSVQAFPEIMEKIAGLRSNSNSRRRLVDESGNPGEIARSESMVSFAETIHLLGDN